MLPRMLILASTMVLAGTMIGIGHAAGCADQSYQQGVYAPSGSPVFTAPEKNHYYYFGAPVADANGPTVILPLSEWHESNGMRGLQVQNCFSNGMFVGGADSPDPSLLS